MGRVSGSPPPPGVSEEDADIEHETTFMMTNDAPFQLIAVLTEALQETRAEVAALKDRITALEAP